MVAKRPARAYSVRAMTARGRQGARVGEQLLGGLVARGRRGAAIGLVAVASVTNVTS